MQGCHSYGFTLILRIWDMRCGIFFKLHTCRSLRIFQQFFKIFWFDLCPLGLATELRKLKIQTIGFWIFLQKNVLWGFRGCRSRIWHYFSKILNPKTTPKVQNFQNFFSNFFRIFKCFLFLSFRASGLAAYLYHFAFSSKKTWTYFLHLTFCLLNICLLNTYTRMYVCFSPWWGAVKPVNKSL